MKKIIFVLLIFLMLPCKTMAFSTSAECAILMDQNSKRVLYEKNIHKVKSVASISKIMTAILAIESGKTNDIVLVDEEVLKAYGSAIYIKPGENILLLDLVYGLMLRSGNDAALTIAKYVSGNVEKFITLMNEKAKEIGMKNTTFNNPSGLDNETGNYSTVYDMAILTSYAMQNDIYKRVTSTKKHIVKTNMNVYEWFNKNKLLNLYKYTTGGKTGFTEKAKRTLVTTATKNNLNLVVVTLNDGNDFYDHQKLYENAFNEYKNYEILKGSRIDIINENYYNTTFYLKNNFHYPMFKNEINNIYLKIQLEKKRKYNNGEKVGVVKVVLGDTEIYKDDIFVSKIKIKKTFWGWLKNLW